MARRKALRDCSFAADGEADRDTTTPAPVGALPPLIAMRGNYLARPGRGCVAGMRRRGCLIWDGDVFGAARETGMTCRLDLAMSALEKFRAKSITIRETTMPGTVRLHRVLNTKPEKVYRAFTEADAFAKWLPPNGFTCTVHHLEAKVGGTFKMSFRNFTTGNSHSFGGTYVELKPGELLRYTDVFDDPNLPGEMHVTVILRAVSVGTEINIMQEGIPDAIPVEACYLGWQESLRSLAKLVEPEINQ